MHKVLLFLLLVTFQSAEAHLYFAYGSNLNYEFFKERLKDGEWVDSWHREGVLTEEAPRLIGSYVLENYEFGYTFNAEPFGDSGASANIFPKEGSKVYGVVYEISDDQLRELDKTEDVPEAYERVAVTVYNVTDTLQAWTYVGNPKYLSDDLDLDPEYMELVVQGAYQNQLPEEYINQLLGRCNADHR